jgi:hypothetical protein
VPKANQAGFAGIEPDGTLKIRLVSPPVSGQDNEELIDFLAQFLRVPRGAIEIVAGLDGRKKLVSILNITTAEIQRIIEEASAREDF